MEESGHYYTVYFASLAVGFNKDISYRHALLAQMPDEVGYLDAANLHIKQCKPTGKEFNLRGRLVAPPSNWRFLIEYVIHSLPDRQNGNRSSSFQRNATRQLLRKNRPDSLEFGLLLHRLGDTYAHSVMGNEKVMYTTTTSGATVDCFKPDSLGHAKHMHDPDYPFKRISLFYQYLEDLYDILYEKAVEKDSFLFRSNRKPLSKAEVKSIFNSILGPRGLVGGAVRAGISSHGTQTFFISQIREVSQKNLGIKMEPYRPELNEELQTLASFLLDHAELLRMRIDEKMITEALSNIAQEL